MLITKPVIEKYDRIFKFLVELCKLNAMIKKTFGIITDPQIHKYRFALHHFITEFTTFVKSSIIEATWQPFIQNLSKQDMMQFSEYQDYILDSILYPCFLKKGQTKIYQILQPILKDISLFYQVVSAASHQDPEKTELKCRRIYEQFKINTNIFYRVLVLLETKGIKNAGFAKDLLIRLQQ